MKGEESPTYQKLQKQFNKLTSTEPEINDVSHTMSDISFAMDTTPTTDIDKKLEELISSGFDLSIL